MLNADTRPLAKAELVREPGNKYDKNAVAIHASGAGCVGYVNKQNAARLSKHLGVGEEYMAIFTSGCKRGDDSVPVSVLIAPTATMMSISAFSNSAEVGLTMYFHPYELREPQRSGPLKGISETAKAAEAAKPANASGKSSPSAENNIIFTYTSAW